MSGGDVLYSEVQVHLNNLATLSAQVDHTANAKDAADLQNRIAAENGHVVLGSIEAVSVEHEPASELEQR